MRAYSKEEVRAYNADIQRLLEILPTTVDSPMLIADIRNLAFTKCPGCDDNGKQSVQCGRAGCMEELCKLCGGSAYRHIR